MARSAPQPRLPIPYDRLRVVASGTMQLGQIWQAADWYHVQPASVPDAAGIQAIANSMGVVYKTFWTNGVGPFNSAPTLFTAVTVYYYAANATAAATNASATIVSAVGTGTDSSPASTAVVLGKRTSLLNKSGRGRTYWPATGTTTGNVFTTAKINAMSAAAKVLYDALNSAPPSPLTQCKLTVPSARLGTIHEVLSVTVDARPDRIEHRERHVTYAKSTALLNP